MKDSFVFGSESVTEGHPDKLCDQMSDAIVDHFLQQDPGAAVIVECAVSTAIVFVAARFASAAGSVDFAQLVRQVIDEVGYRQGTFSARTCGVLTSLKELPASRRTAQIDPDAEDLERTVAQESATVFGFACNQTPALLPLPIWLAHKLARRLATVRTEGLLPYLCPDGKTQVSVEYRRRQPYRIHGLTLLVSLSDPRKAARLQEEIRSAVIEPVFASEPIRPDGETRIFIEGNGTLAVGGPEVHAGLTGRKTAIDTYGEYSRHSGAALSGKDPSRIDRIGAYAARYAAKNVVAAGLAEQCEVQLSYAVGLSHPVSVQVETFGSGRLADEVLATLVEKHFDFRPAGILRDFDLRRLPALHPEGFYRRLATYGQMGRLDLVLPWEKIDRTAFLL